MPRTTTPKAPATNHPVLGRLPVGWKRVRLGAAVELIMGQSPPGNTYNTDGEGLPLINGPTEFTDRHPVKIQWTTTPTKTTRSSDILLCVRGSSTGRMNIADGEYCIGRGVCAIRGTEDTDTEFLSYLMQSVLAPMLRLSTGSTFANIDSKSIKSVYVLLPPLPEQRRIARILGTWDKAIGLLGQQIAAKEERLRGLIDQLVSGKRHGAKGDKLPKGWRWVSLGEVFEFLSTTSHSRSQLSDDPAKGDVLYIHYGDIHATYTTPRLDLNSEEQVPRLLRGTAIPSSADYLKDGDLIIADASEDIEGVGACVELHNVDGKQVFSGLHTLALRDTKGLTVHGYRGYLLRSHQVVKRIREVATGSKVYGLSRSNLAKLKVPLPSPEEQRIIGSCLNGAYDELDLLRTKLAQLREQKRGLMQRLLAGANS